MGELRLHEPARGLQFWPRELRTGDRLRIAFAPPGISGTDDRDHHEIVLTDGWRPIATIAAGILRRSAGVICVEWEGRDDHGRPVPAGTYRVIVTRTRSNFRLERTLVIDR